jgi:hypothetical protein
MHRNVIMLCIGLTTILAFINIIILCAGPDNIPGLWRSLEGKMMASGAEDGSQETDPMLAGLGASGR